MLTYAVVGSPETVRAGLERFVAQTAADEVMVVSAIYDHAARLHSYEILARAARLADRRRLIGYVARVRLAVSRSRADDGHGRGRADKRRWCGWRRHWTVSLA